ncbi:hypothetical protein, partial [Salmonella enterica]|uniref:hypothetical protein n=1 Tax=Salmonella enterica TaxID=28901 RepID=UPI0032B32C69
MNTMDKDVAARGRRDNLKLSMRAMREAGNTIDLTFLNVNGHPDGLIEADAARRLAKDGPNDVARERRLPAIV